MAEEGKTGKKDWVAGVVVAEDVRGPEIGPGERAATAPTLFEWARDLRDNHPEDLKIGLIEGMKKGNVQCLKMFLDLANGVGLSAGVPEAEYRSFAEELRELFRVELEEMQGAGNRE